MTGSTEVCKHPRVSHPCNTMPNIRHCSQYNLTVGMSAGDCLVMVLVDKCKLRYSSEPPPEERKDSGLPSYCCGLMQISYRGHYIVLTSWVEGAQAFRVEDPAMAVATYITAVSLDRARTSYGTDEDILVVSRRRQCSETSS